MPEPIFKETVWTARYVAQKGNSNPNGCQQTKYSMFSTQYWYKYDATNCTTGVTGNDGQIQCITDNMDSGRTVA